MQTNHHIFTYHEVKAKVIEIYGKPRTDDEHIFTQTMTRTLWRRLPTVMIDAERHKQIHAKEKAK